MPYLFQLIFLCFSSLFASNEDANVPNADDLKQQPKIALEEKKTSFLENVGYGYQSQETSVTSGFSGKAYYKLPSVNSLKNEKKYWTAGAKVSKSSNSIKEFSDENQMTALAQIGYNLELEKQDNQRRSLHIELAQPVFDTQSHFTPSLELSYDLEF